MMDHFLPTYCNWMIEVTLNSSDFCIIYEPDTEQQAAKEGKPEPLKLEDAELVLIKADLAVNLVDLTPSGREVVQRQLNGSPGKLRIPYVDYDVINMSIPATQAEFTTVTNMTRYPRRIYAVFVAESDMLGKRDTTPLYYRNLNLRKFELTINGQPHSVSTDFPNNTYLEGYQGMVRAMSVANRGLILDRTNWAQAQCIWVFDLTAAHLAGCLDIISAPSEYASWNIQLEFRDQLPFNVNMIIILEKEALMELDKDYNVNIM